MIAHKRTRTLAYAGVRVLFCFLLFFVPLATHAEFIESFDVDIAVTKNGVFEVTENIGYVFTEDRHGIYRCIPTLHPEPASSWTRERYIDIALASVQFDGSDVPYTEEKKRGEVCIKIGDPEAVVTGTHQYKIRYVVGGALSYAAYGGAEIYWNVTGNEWAVPIRAVTVDVTSPDGILIRERACYQGNKGSEDSCAITTSEDGIVTFQGFFLDAYEGVTIAQALDRSKIAYDVRERYRSSIFILGGLFLLIPITIIGVYRYKTRFKTGKTIIPQYEPYAGVKPMYAGLLFDKRLDPRDITAGIVYLAKEGFLSIKKIDRKVLFFFEVDDYEMTLLKPLNTITDVFDHEIIRLIFDDLMDLGAKVTLSDLKKFWSAHNNAERLLALRTKLLDDLTEKGFFTELTFSLPVASRKWRPLLIFGFIALLLLGGFILVPIVALVVVAVISGRRTRKGYEALDHLKGFKEFLRITDSERFVFHNAPEKNAEQFMEYLPYAIAFGVEKEWAKTFEGITIPNPTWYDGGTSASQFSAIGLSDSLSGFSSSFGSSTGSSASSGGGSSGGGSGGGGGGSW